MIYDDIYLVLTDVSMTESTNTRERSLTVTYDETVRDTFRPHWQIMKDLKSCTNTASLSIKSKSAGEWIMQADGNIHCKVYQGDPTAIGNLPIFTGYLADKYTWGFTTGGDKVLNITIEDPTRVLDRIYTDSPTYKSWNTLLGAITDIVTEVNSHLATEEQIGIGTVQTVVKDLSKRIDDDETCQNLLDTLCFECQRVLYFDTQGNINTLSIANAEETGLPEGYTEVEYLQNNGRYCYVDSGIQFTNNLKIALDCNIALTASRDFIFGSDSTYKVTFRGNLNAYTAAFGREEYAMYDKPSGRHTILFDNNLFYMDGTLEHTFSALPSSFATSNMFLFASRSGGQSESVNSNRIYSFKVWSNGTQIANMVPCKHTVDSVTTIGFYDTIRNSFHTSSGSAQCLAGPEVPSSGALDRSNLIAYNGKDVWSVQKEVLQYKNAKCYGKTLKSYNNALVYKVTEGHSSSHPDCYVEVPTMTAFPSGVTIESSSEDTELKLVNNVGKVLEGEGQGKDVIAMSNVVAEVGFTGATPEPGTGHAYIEKINDLQMWCLAKNMSASSIHVTKWQATANVIVEDETIVERTGDALDLEKVYEYECEFLHDQESIQQLSNMIAQYYTNSNKEYTFYTKLDLNLGTTVYGINASPYGLSTKVLPYKKEALRDIYKYTAVGWAPFDLVADTNSKKYVPWSPGPGPVGPQGPQGEEGEPGEPGEDAKIWMFNSTSETFDRNLRNSDSQTIELTGQISGYTETPTYTSDYGTITQTGNDAVLTIPYNQSTYDEITVVMKYGSSTPASETYYEKTFTVIDKTSYDHYLGFIANPAAYTSETIIVGDYFVATGDDADYNRGNAYEKQSNGNWLPIAASNTTLAGHISASDKLLDCLNRLKQESGIDLSTISDANTISWFNTLVADEGVFNKLFAKKLTMTGSGQIWSDNFDGDPDENYDDFKHGYMLSGTDGIIRAVGAKFKNISVDDNSTFMGDINSECFKTTNAGGDGQTRNIQLQSSGARWSGYDYAQKLASAGIASDGIYSISGDGNYIRRGTSVLQVATIGYNQTLQSYTCPWESYDYGSMGAVYWRISNNVAAAMMYSRSSTGTVYSVPANSSVDITDMQRGETITYVSQGVIRGNMGISSVCTNIGSRHACSIIKLETGFLNWNWVIDVAPEYNYYYAAAIPTITYNGTAISVPALYKWDNSILPTTPGGGNVSSGSTLTLVNRNGSISISGKSLQTVYWSGNTALYLTDADNNSYVLDTNTYYQSLGGYFTVPSRQNLVESTTIIPRSDATHPGPYYLGSSQRKWKQVYAESYSGDNYFDSNGNKLLFPGFGSSVVIQGQYTNLSDGDALFGYRIYSDGTQECWGIGGDSGFGQGCYNFNSSKNCTTRYTLPFKTRFQTITLNSMNASDGTTYYGLYTRNDKDTFTARCTSASAARAFSYIARGVSGISALYVATRSLTLADAKAIYDEDHYSTGTISEMYRWFADSTSYYVLIAFPCSDVSGYYVVPGLYESGSVPSGITMSPSSISKKSIICTSTVISQA